MKRIKRNKMVEKGIILARMLSKIDGETPSEYVDGIVNRYKEECGSRYIFTAEETENIMQALKAMPGYTPERFFVAGSPLDCESMSPNMHFSWHLYIAYIMLSITNPELFEDYKEEKNGKDSEKNED